MRAGKMPHRVRVLENQVASHDDFNQPIENWVVVATRWAEVSPGEGQEVLEASQTLASITHVVRLRHVDWLTPAHRFSHRGRTLQIVSVVNPAEAGVESVCRCVEVV